MSPLTGLDFVCIGFSTIVSTPDLRCGTGSNEAIKKHRRCEIMVYKQLRKTLKHRRCEIINEQI